MLKNAYLLAKIGADTAENEQHFAEILPIGRRVTDRCRRLLREAPVGGAPRDHALEQRHLSILAPREVRADRGLDAVSYRSTGA